MPDFEPRWRRPRAVAAAAAVITVLGAAVALAGGAGPAAAQGPSPVEVDAVRVESLNQTAPVIGRVVARERGTVAALTGGPVAEITVEVGARVAEGDVLMRLQRDRLEQTLAARRADVARRRAALETARSERELARQELARLERLKDSPAFSGARYEDQSRALATAEARVGEAEAAIAQARAEVRLAEIELERGTVRAPFDGVVVEKHTVRGAYVTVGAPVLTLINDGDLELEADVPTRMISGLEAGRVVEMSLSEGGPRYDAIVRARVPEENALTKTRLVRFVPGMPDDALKRPLAAGQTVTLHVPVGARRDVVTVHKDAVLPQGGGDSVFVVVDGKAQPRPVELGPAVGQRFVVEDGLKPGEPVVVRGNERLRPGQSVQYPGMKDGGGNGGNGSGGAGAGTQDGGTDGDATAKGTGQGAG